MEGAVCVFGGWGGLDPGMAKYSRKPRSSTSASDAAPGKAPAKRMSAASSTAKRNSTTTSSASVPPPPSQPPSVPRRSRMTDVSAASSSRCDATSPAKWSAGQAADDDASGAPAAAAAADSADPSEEVTGDVLEKSAARQRAKKHSAGP
jgi:hypothetical protein